MTEGFFRPDEMSDEQLAECEAALQVAQLGRANLVLAEFCRAGAWLTGSAAASGWAGGFMLAALLSDTLRFLLALAGIVAAAICLGGAGWHRRRAGTYQAEGKALTGPLAAIRAEQVRRGAGTVKTLEVRAVDGS